ncbi:MAG: radical SAM protein [Cyclobacteriaceae bacterium]
MVLSHYTVFSEFLNDEKESILFSTRTSQGFVVSEDIRNSLLNGEVDSLSESTIESLRQMNIVVPESENEREEIIRDNEDTINDTDVLYEVIQPSAYCQLGCDYCGQNHTKDYITTELEEKLLERIQQKLKIKKWSAISIGWFGGEPLVGLPQIRSLTKRLKEIAASEGIPYQARVVTNGLSLKRKIFEELVNDLNITGVEVTLDGTAEYHDKVRHTKSKQATFDIIVANLEEIFAIPNYKELGCDVSIRCNVDHRNWEGVSPLIKYLADKNFNEYVSNFYLMGVYSWAGNDAHTKSLTKEEFANNEISWIIEMVEHGFSPNLIPGRVKEVCMAVNPTSEMYDAFGNIYNCTEVSYTDFYKDGTYTLGNLKNTVPLDIPDKPLSDWNNQVRTDATLPCHTCRMLPVCGGACPKSWHEDMRACPSNKFNIEEKLELAYIIDNNIGQVSFPLLTEAKEEEYSEG